MKTQGHPGEHRAPGQIRIQKAAPLSGLSAEVRCLVSEPVAANGNWAKFQGLATIKGYERLSPSGQMPAMVISRAMVRLTVSASRLGVGRGSRYR